MKSGTAFLLIPHISAEIKGHLSKMYTITDFNNKRNKKNNNQSCFFSLPPDEKISWEKVKILCVWIWLYALIWALFPILGWGEYGPEPFGLSCSLAWGQMKKEDFSFVITMFSFNLVIPSVIIICCYFGITINLYFTYKRSMNNSSRVPNIVKLHRRLLIVSDFFFWWESSIIIGLGILYVLCLFNINIYLEGNTDLNGS